MAHMWFGDLVTMKWWDDLWLNESFAEWACYHAAVENTEFTESWTGFTNARKNWALRQDQLPSTHPIAADNYDLQAVEVNFDGITYAKGASVAQAAGRLGRARARSWPACGSTSRTTPTRTPSSPTCSTALEKSSGRELDSWAKEWLQTSRRQHPHARRSSSTPTARYASFAVRADRGGRLPDAAPPPHRHRPLRPRRDGRLVRRTTSRSTSRASCTDDRRAGRRRRSPTCCCSTTATCTYAKIRLDERSLATVVERPRPLDDSLARALCWGAAWDMTRDAEMSATDFVALVLREHRRRRPTRSASRGIPSTPPRRVNHYSAPGQPRRAAGDAGSRAARAARWPPSPAATTS